MDDIMFTFNMGEDEMTYDHRFMGKGTQPNRTLTEIGKEIGEICQAKNKAYGDSFAKTGAILKALYPNGVGPSQYGDMLAIVRILDKLFRIATRKDAFGESPFSDIAGYGILGVLNDQNETAQDNKGGGA
jgi:hypothetical protein